MQLVIGAMVAIGIAVVGASAIAMAQAGQSQVNALEILVNRLESPLSEGDAANRERLRVLFFNEHGQLR